MSKPTSTIAFKGTTMIVKTKECIYTFPIDKMTTTYQDNKFCFAKIGELYCKKCFDVSKEEYKKFQNYLDSK